MHKCRVFKSYWQGFKSGRLMWLGQCYDRECYYSRAYFTNRTWEEAIVEAIIHRNENK